jgi:transposase
LTIDKELEAKILRYHFVEHWGPHTIAAQLGIHHSSVDRVLSQAGMPKAERARQVSIVDPYLPFIIETLAQYPRLTAARLYAMAQQRGYPGGSSHFRSQVAQLRPRKPSEAYLRLRTLPGEQAQVDWGLCRARHKPHYADTKTMPSCCTWVACGLVFNANRPPM